MTTNTNAMLNPTRIDIDKNIPRNDPAKIALNACIRQIDQLPDECDRAVLIRKLKARYSNDESIMKAYEYQQALEASQQEDALDYFNEINPS